MTLKSNKDRTLDNEMDTRWRSKGGSHGKRTIEPRVCHTCGGRGMLPMLGDKQLPCLDCGGTGEII